MPTENTDTTTPDFEPDLGELRELAELQKGHIFLATEQTKKARDFLKMSKDNLAEANRIGKKIQQITFGVMNEN